MRCYIIVTCMQHGVNKFITVKARGCSIQTFCKAAHECYNECSVILVQLRFTMSYIISNIVYYAVCQYISYVFHQFSCFQDTHARHYCHRCKPIFPKIAPIPILVLVLVHHYYINTNFIYIFKL